LLQEKNADLISAARESCVRELVKWERSLAHVQRGVLLFLLLAGLTATDLLGPSDEEADRWQACADEIIARVEQ